MVSFPGMVQGYFGHYDSKLEAQPLGRVSLQLGLAGLARVTGSAAHP